MYKIITQEDDFIVIDKSAGVNFHDEGDLGKGLFSQLKAELSVQSTELLFPIHRLDKMTSGLLIFSKTLACAQAFQVMFNEHKIEKFYLAISDKKPTKKQGLVKGDMAKSRRGTWKLLRTSNNPAVTQFLSYHIENDKRLFLLKPQTGKTHQIRVALNSLGAPIIGDTRYHSHKTKNTKEKETTKDNNTDRGYLHAYAMRFNYLGKQYQYVLPPSSGRYFSNDKLKNKLADLSQPWQLNWPNISANY